MEGNQPLKTYRESNSLSRDDLAALIGVDRATVFRWETGQRKPGVEKLSKITEVTGIPAKELRPDLAAAMDEPE